MRKVLLFFVSLFMLLFCGCNADVMDQSLPESETLWEPIQTETQLVQNETVLDFEEQIMEATLSEIENEFNRFPVANEIMDGFGIFYKDWNCVDILSDDNHYSKMSISNSERVYIASDMAFGSIYFEWDSIPGEFILSWDTGEMLCGLEGFLHDYITLPEEVNQIHITFPDDGYRLLCDIRIFTFGSAPEGIQDWSCPCEAADILVFPTHSDDETLFFGPLIAWYAIEHNMTVQTAFMVNHAGFPERSHERLDALWELGVRNYPVLGMAPDTDSRDLGECLYFYSGSNILQWQVEQIRRFQPLVVAGHDLDGEYGNGGHKVNAHYLIEAVEYAADQSFDVQSSELYGIWDTPKLYLHLYEQNSWMLDVNLPLTGDPLGRTSFQIAEDAFAFHKSQHRFGFHVKQNVSQPEYDCRPFGLYRSLVGPDSCADIMDNIRVEEWRS